MHLREGCTYVLRSTVFFYAPLSPLRRKAYSARAAERRKGGERGSVSTSTLYALHRNLHVADDVVVALGCFGETSRERQSTHIDACLAFVAVSISQVPLQVQQTNIVSLTFAESVATMRVRAFASLLLASAPARLGTLSVVVPFPPLCNICISAGEKGRIGGKDGRENISASGR